MTEMMANRDELYPGATKIQNDDQKCDEAKGGGVGQNDGSKGTALPGRG